MKGDLKTGTIILVVIAFTIINLMAMGLLAVATWIYLVMMVRKKKITLFHDQTEPKLAENRLTSLKAFLKAAGLTFIVAIAGIILHNVLSGLSGTEEPISFFIGVGALWIFIILSAVCLGIFLKGQQKLI